MVLRFGLLSYFIKGHFICNKSLADKQYQSNMTKQWSLTIYDNYWWFWGLEPFTLYTKGVKRSLYPQQSFKVHIWPFAPLFPIIILIFPSGGQLACLLCHKTSRKYWTRLPLRKLPRKRKTREGRLSRTKASRLSASDSQGRATLVCIFKEVNWLKQINIL